MKSRDRLKLGKGVHVAFVGFCGSGEEEAGRLLKDWSASWSRMTERAFGGTLSERRSRRERERRSLLLLFVLEKINGNVERATESVGGGKLGKAVFRCSSS